jgi:hypothetical protein
VPLGIAFLVLLWMPSVADLASRELGPAESAWVEEAIRDEPPSPGSALSRQLVRVPLHRTGVAADAPHELTSAQRRAIRMPGAVGSVVGLVVFYLLARFIVGGAGGLLAAALLAICGPWVRAGTSALPVVVGEALLLLGVASALVLQARHREVGVATATAARISIAGVFLGIGLLLAPPGISTFLAILAVWFLLALRRASSEATTLPVENPSRIVSAGVLGAAVLLATSAAAAWGAERLAGGSGISFSSWISPALDPGLALWRDVYRGVLSPTAATDLVVLAAIPLIFIVRVLEWSEGRPWRAAGLLPWIFLGLYLSALRGAPESDVALLVPITVPPLFVLGLGWIVLRGLRPGRIRRQEYTFVLTWLGCGLLLAPFAGRAPQDPRLAAIVTLLPAVVLVAGRAGRALWEAHEAILARTGILVIAYVPVLAFALGRIAGNGPLHDTSQALEKHVFAILLGAVALGVVSETIHVRPDVAASLPPVRSRRRFRRGGPRGPRGGARGGRRRGGGRRSGRAVRRHP